MTHKSIGIALLGKFIAGGIALVSKLPQAVLGEVRAGSPAT